MSHLHGRRCKIPFRKIKTISSKNGYETFYNTINNILYIHIYFFIFFFIFLYIFPHKQTKHTATLDIYSDTNAIIGYKATILQFNDDRVVVNGMN